MRILYAQLFTNISLHYHVCDGLCLNLTQLFIFVLTMIALTGFKIFIADISEITVAALYKFNYWRYKTFINPPCLFLTRLYEDARASLLHIF